MRGFTLQIIKMVKDGRERNVADILTALGFELYLLSSNEKESFKKTFWRNQVRPLIRAEVLIQIDGGGFVVINGNQLLGEGGSDV